MPRRRPTRRRRSRKRGPGKALRAVRTLSKFVDRELHIHDILDQNDITSTGLILLLTGINEGDTRSTRMGVQVTARSLRLSLFFAVGNQEALTRVILVIDRQTNGAFPTFADILQNVGTTGQVMSSAMNTENSKRFKVLWDRKVRTNSVDLPVHTTGVFKRLTHKVRYNGAGAGIGTALSGTLFLFLLSNTVGGANSPNVTTQSRLVFAP